MKNKKLIKIGIIFLILVVGGVAVYLLVMEYFITFRYCWVVILNALIILIYGYYHLLEILITSFLTYPTIYYSIIGLAIALIGSYKIVKVLVNKM